MLQSPSFIAATTVSHSARRVLMTASTYAIKSSGETAGQSGRRDRCFRGLVLQRPQLLQALHEGGVHLQQILKAHRAADQSLPHQQGEPHAERRPRAQRDAQKLAKEAEVLQQARRRSTGVGNERTDQTARAADRRIRLVRDVVLQSVGRRYQQRQDAPKWQAG
eukprot:scaffold213_cov245-Pinguiococcus_pyrenoidosus.AAC.41